MPTLLKTKAITLRKPSLKRPHRVFRGGICVDLGRLDDVVLIEVTSWSSSILFWALRKERESGACWLIRT